MKSRKLRIAWTVFWGTACLLLIALWVRSYWFMDSISKYSSNGKDTHASSDYGRIVIYTLDSRIPRAGESWAFRSNRFGEVIARPAYILPGVPGYTSQDSIRVVLIPIWSIILIVAPLAAGPWLRWRFSLRTLLIATTLVTVALGLVIYFARY